MNTVSGKGIILFRAI